jgi:hypothetical protein
VDRAQGCKFQHWLPQPALPKEDGELSAPQGSADAAAALQPNIVTIMQATAASLRTLDRVIAAPGEALDVSMALTAQSCERTLATADGETTRILNPFLE